MVLNVLNTCSVPENFRQPKLLVTSPLPTHFSLKYFVFLFAILDIYFNYLKLGNLSTAFINFSRGARFMKQKYPLKIFGCLLYTSDAADDYLEV